MNTLERAIDKRTLFVTMGCAKWPYQKIKDELFGANDKLDIHQVMALPLLSEEKVVVLQELDFFCPGLQRLLALHFATGCYEDARDSLTAADDKLASEALAFLRAVLLGEIDKQEYPALRDTLRAYLQTELYPLDYEPNRLRIGVFEVILCVLKPKPYRALREASSMQRYLFGLEKADVQLRDMLRFANNYFL